MSPGRTVLSVSRPARPRPAVPPCAPTRPASGTSGFRTRQVLDKGEIFEHALHEKGSQSQKWRCSTCQQPGTKSAPRPADKPLINRLSTGCQPPVVFPHRLTWDFARSCFWGDVQETCLCFRCLGGYGGRSSPGRNVLSAARSARPPRRAPRPEPPVVCLGFGLDRCLIVFVFLCMQGMSVNLMIPKPGHITSSAGGGGAQRRGGRAGAGRGGAGRGGARWEGGGSVSPGDNHPACPPGHRENMSWTIPQRHKQRKLKSHVNRTVEHNVQLAIG